LNHLVNHREERGYLFLAIDYLDYHRQVFRESKDFRGVNPTRRPIPHKPSQHRSPRKAHLAGLENQRFVQWLSFPFIGFANENA
jgi:hypothetical protein